jgi:hypothetical protein
MASLGVKIDDSINREYGPRVFKIHGALYHQHGQLLPDDNGNIKYAQVYFLDTSEAQIQRRMQNNQRNQLQAGVLSTIQVAVFLKKFYHLKLIEILGCFV